MDGRQFDTLTKRLATTPLTRSNALRGLVASGAALAGVTLSGNASDARRKNNKTNNNKKKICHCTGDTVVSCGNKKVKKKKLKKFFKKSPCSYGGKCRGFNPCSASPTCLENEATCALSEECCSFFCGTVGGPNPACCVPPDAPCGKNSDCCRNAENPALCESGRCCVNGGGTCATPNDFLTGDCCSGFTCDVGNSNKCVPN